jgi:hypothetical protein
MDKNPARFALIEEKLTDGSKIFGVRFFDDDDLELEVRIGCVDQSGAEALLDVLKACASEIQVDCGDEF